MGEPGTEDEAGTGVERGTWLRFTLVLQLTFKPGFCEELPVRAAGQWGSGSLGSWGFAFHAACHSTARLAVQSVWQAEAWEERGVINVKSWRDA